MVFCKKKEAKATEQEKQLEKAGERYTYVAIDAVSRFVIAISSGRRVQETANKLLQLVAKRVILSMIILFTSDDWDQYLPAIKKSFGYFWRPRRIKKQGRKKKLELRLSPNILYGIVKKIKNTSGKVIATVRKIVCGSEIMVNKLLSQSPVSTVLNTSFVERINGTFRALCSCLVRKSYSFSKNSISHDAHVVIVTSYYNFIKPHRTLTKKFGEETTPAMAANLTDHCWRWEDLCNFPINCQSN